MKIVAEIIAAIFLFALLLPLFVNVFAEERPESACEGDEEVVEPGRWCSKYLDVVGEER